MMKFEDISLHWINRLGFLVRRELADRFKANGHNIGAEEWAVLLHLWRQDGLAPSDIADATIKDRTTITRFIDGMEKKGLLTRQADPTDRRRFQIILTEQGRDLEAKLVPIAEGIIGEVHEGLSQDEHDILVRLLRKMTKNLTG